MCSSDLVGVVPEHEALALAVDEMAAAAHEGVGPLGGVALGAEGAAIYQLHVNPNRTTKVLHRKPGARDWEVVELEWAMDRVAELTKQTRDDTFIERLSNGKLVNMTPAIFALGGATLDSEFNHVCQKFWRGLGVVAIENQARI